MLWFYAAKETTASTAANCGNVANVTGYFAGRKDQQMTLDYVTSAGAKSTIPQHYYNANFAIRAVAVWEAGSTGDPIGFQLKIVNVAPHALLVNGLYSFPGIFAHALAGDPVFPSALEALKAWGDPRYPVSNYMQDLDNATHANYYAKLKKK